MRYKVTIYLKSGQVIRLRAAHAGLTTTNGTITKYNIDDIEGVRLIHINVEDIAGIIMHKSWLGH